MKLGLLAASVAAVALGAGSASAQVLVPHRNHYHVVPAYPAYPSYGYRSFQPGLSFSFNFGSPRVYQPAFGHGGYGPRYSGYGSRYGGFNPGWGGGRYHNGHYHR